MEFRALGDSAWLIEAEGADSRRQLEETLALAETLRRERVPEILDIVSSFASLAVYFDPADGERVAAWLSARAPRDPGRKSSFGRTVEIPVVYGNLETLAALGKTADELIRLHSSPEYTVAAIGFSPGFPYLAGLSAELSLPRLASPRPVEAGSVAIAGGQAGIYPCASQGGWHVLGKTTAELFRADREEPSLLRPGDKVRFVPVKEAPLAKRPQAPILPSEGALEILDPGPMTSVQDLGRPGFRHLGVSSGGAADPVAAAAANLLAGNPRGAAVLECCLRGPVIKFHQSCRLAFTGWEDSRSGSVIEVAEGEEIDLRTPLRSVRGYLAIAGGIATPLVMGSRATDLRSGFGGLEGRSLRAGDRLPIGPPRDGPKPGPWRIGWPRLPEPGRAIELRFLAGMQKEWFSPGAMEAFGGTLFRVSARSDRMGARLEGAALTLSQPRQLVSQPVVPGSVQVPPDGQPIVLMPECQTIGGYPQIGHVISADLPKLARAWPGTHISFREVSLAEARLAWQELGQSAARFQLGLSFKS